MRRWHEEYPRTYREWRKHYRSHVESNKTSQRVAGKDPYDVDCICDRQKGRFRKRDAWDCGHARCYLCHSDKVPRRQATYQERCAALRLKEGIIELHAAASPPGDASIQVAVRLR